MAESIKTGMAESIKTGMAESIRSLPIRNQSPKQTLAAETQRQKRRRKTRIKRH
jgi:hypothetical protein